MAGGVTVFASDNKSTLTAVVTTVPESVLKGKDICKDNDNGKDKDKPKKSTSTWPTRLFNGGSKNKLEAQELPRASSPPTVLLDALKQGCPSKDHPWTPGTVVSIEEQGQEEAFAQKRPIVVQQMFDASPAPVPNLDTKKSRSVAQRKIDLVIPSLGTNKTSGDAGQGGDTKNPLFLIKKTYSASGKRITLITSSLNDQDSKDDLDDIVDHGKSDPFANLMRVVTQTRSTSSTSKLDDPLSKLAELVPSDVGLDCDVSESLGSSAMTTSTGTGTGTGTSTVGDEHISVLSASVVGSRTDALSRKSDLSEKEAQAAAANKEDKDKETKKQDPGAVCADDANADTEKEQSEPFEDELPPGMPREISFDPSPPKVKRRRRRRRRRIQRDDDDDDEGEGKEVAGQISSTSTTFWEMILSICPLLNAGANEVVAVEQKDKKMEGPSLSLPAQRARTHESKVEYDNVEIEKKPSVDQDDDDDDDDFDKSDAECSSDDDDNTSNSDTEDDDDDDDDDDDEVDEGGKLSPEVQFRKISAKQLKDMALLGKRIYIKHTSANKCPWSYLINCKPSQIYTKIEPFDVKPSVSKSLEAILKSRFSCKTAKSSALVLEARVVLYQDGTSLKNVLFHGETVPDRVELAVAWTVRSNKFSWVYEGGLEVEARNIDEEEFRKERKRKNSVYSSNSPGRQCLEDTLIPNVAIKIDQRIREQENGITLIVQKTKTTRKTKRSWQRN